jgi:myo-inositol-1(or 4)-monophosphatase
VREHGAAPRWAPPAPAELEGLAAGAARSAAAVVMETHGRPQLIGQKSSPTDVVTETDLRAETLIRKLLLEATPEAGLLGEESATTAPSARLQWVIDPLDGTVNFMYGVPEFAVSIAAAVDGEVVAAAVIDAARDELFSAHLGGGARRDGTSISVSDCSSLPSALVATGFSYHAEQRARQGRVAARVIAGARDLRCVGSTALELCWVACGRVDAYFQRETEIWDRAAGALIATEAGARLELPCPENYDLTLAAPPELFEELWSAVQIAAWPPTDRS